MMDRIAEASIGVVREPLRGRFGFKGSSLSELWQVVVRLTLAEGICGMGVGVQSVLWSAPEVFRRYGEKEANKKMLDVTKQALRLIKSKEFTTPPEMIKNLLKPLTQYAAEQIGGVIPQTYVLNALVAVDFALWQIWAQINGTGFDGIRDRFCPRLTGSERELGGIPLITYHMSEEDVRLLLEEGAFLLKIKIGADPGGTGDPEEMLQWDIKRVRQIHRIAKEYATPYTQCGKPVYYLDANGRYPSLDYIQRLLSAMDQTDILDSIVLLEEPFSEDNLHSVFALPVRVAADESAHSSSDVIRLIEQYGYTALACKPVAKTLSVTLEMADAAQQKGAVCFCADLTVPPVMLDWNMAFAATLPRIPELKAGVVESNGVQNYGDWRSLLNLCDNPGAAWRIPQGGVYRLEDGFKDSMLRLHPAYMDIANTSIGLVLK